MRTRNGKIARLPYEIREQLNQRLERSQPSPKVLEWLNALPEVQEVLKEDFDGEPVSRQNLSQWRQGGFEEWQARRDLCLGSEDLVHCAQEMDEHTDDELADVSATVLAGRLGCLIANWDGEVTEEFEAKSRILNRMCRSVVHLQKGARERNRERLEWRRVTEEEEKAEQKEMQEKLTRPWYDTIKGPIIAKIFGGGTVGRKIADYILAVRRGNLDADVDFEATDTFGDGRLFGEDRKSAQTDRKEHTCRGSGKTSTRKAAKPLEAKEMDDTEGVNSGEAKAKPVKVCQSDSDQPGGEGLDSRVAKMLGAIETETPDSWPQEDDV